MQSFMKFKKNDARGQPKEPSSGMLDRKCIVTEATKYTFQKNLNKELVKTFISSPTILRSRNQPLRNYKKVIRNALGINKRYNVKCSIPRTWKWENQGHWGFKWYFQPNTQPSTSCNKYSRVKIKPLLKTKGGPHNIKETPAPSYHPIWWERSWKTTVITLIC